MDIYDEGRGSVLGWSRDLLPISDLSDHCSNAWRDGDATCGGQIVIRGKDKGRKGISERKSQKEN